MSDAAERFTHELRDLMSRYPEDNVAPVLTVALAQITAQIGIPTDVVVDEIRSMRAMIDELAAMAESGDW